MTLHDFLIGWIRGKPTKRLATTFLRTQPTSALDVCPNLVSFLDYNNIGHGDVEIQKMLKESPIAKYNATILSLALPVVSGSGNDALVQSAVASGGLFGSGWVVHLHRAKDGKWSAIGGISTWIS